MLLFVYGTLKSDGPANDLFSRSEFVGEAFTQPRYKLFSATWFPMMKPCHSGKSIKGEVWKVSPEDLKRVDCYEGSGFQRKRVKLQSPFNEKEVFAYFYKYEATDEIGTVWEN